MPFPNEHAARQTDPKQYKGNFRRKHPKGFPAGVDVVFGIKTVDGKKKAEIQTIRFKSSKWTVSAARKWLKDHGFKTAIEAAVKPKKTAEAAAEATRKSKNLWDGVL